MKIILLIIIGLVVFLVFSIIIHQNFDFSKMDKTDSFSSLTCQNAIYDWIDLAHKIDKVPEDVARNMNMSSMPEDVLRRMHIFSQDVLITDELLKQKNNATLAVLNNCDVKSLTSGKIQQLDHWENRQ